MLGLLTFMEHLEPVPVAVRDPDARQPDRCRSRSAFLSYAYYTDYSQVFAATAVGTVPLVLVFIVFGRQIIGGIMEGAVKA